MKYALLVIDMQKASYSGREKRFMDKAARKINEAAALFRGRGFPVVWIQHDNGKDASPGKVNFEMIDTLKPLDEEKRIVKHYLNSFNKTELLSFLQSRNVDTPVVAGFCAEYCVLATFRGAEDLDLAPLMLKGALASGTGKNIRFVEKLAKTVSLEELAG
ncbi:MAG: isochorismatase family protein [Treponema sp.]|jgi:nicotinamidase-related amidase|nr:isochorismatase family protein [Treponema sp.]